MSQSSISSSAQPPRNAVEESPADTPPADFEAAVAELEQIVMRMEGGELALEQSLAAYRRGTQLLQFCQSVLRDAQQQVKILEGNMLQDFHGAENGD